MAVITLNRKEFEKNFKLTPEVLEKSRLMGAPIEDYGENEDIQIEITPNRPDLLSLQGFMRAFKAFLGKEQGLKTYKLLPPEKDFKVTIDKSVEKVRPFTACAIVKGLKLDDSKIKEIMDLQEKLHATLGRNRKKVAIGVYPLEKISLPIRYEARSPDKIKFIPLESEKEMTGSQILREHPKGRDFAHLLDNQSVYPVFVDAKGKILSMPPIINSHETGKVSEETKDVFIECSGSDFDTLKKALNIVVTVLADIGGKIYRMNLEYGKKNEMTPSLDPEKMKISIENVNSILGFDLKEKDLEKLLPKMGYDIKGNTVMIPAWRTDIIHEVDIIEDVAIAYGYENITPEIPEVSTIGEQNIESKVKSKISEILSGLGLLEISSYHLIKEDEAKKSKLSEKIEVEDSKTEYKILRPNLMIPSLRIISENKDSEYPQKMFEMGTVFNLGKTDTGIKEDKHLMISCIPSNFTELKQILDYLMRMLNLEYSIKDSSHPNMIDGRTGDIIVNNKSLGFIGEVHPEILDNWNIKQPVAILEINLEEIFKKF